MSKSASNSSAPTIRTVASQAGVGVGTVSRVLNGGSVSSDTRSAVVKAIADLGFTPHTAARSLATRRSCTVGLVVNSTRGSWFSELIAGVEEALAPSRRSVVIGSLRLSGEYDSKVVRGWIQERRVDGILFVRFSARERPLLKAAHAAQLPVALIAPDVKGDAEVQVRVENSSGGELIARHLLDLGHRRIAFVGGPKTSRDTQERLRGLSQELKRFMPGLAPDGLWYAPSYYADGGVEYAQKFLAMKKRPTAVAFANDALALGFAKHVMDHGLRIPDDVSISGFDGSPESALFWPGLTTIAQPSRAMAAGASRALLACIDEQSDKPVELQSRYEVELVVRQSTGAPRVSSRATRKK